jgi:hypothetical protein
MCLALSTRPLPGQIGWSGSGPHSRRRIAATPRRGPVRRVTWRVDRIAPSLQVGTPGGRRTKGW